MKQPIASALRSASHPAFIIGCILTAVGIAFNVSYGVNLGGSDPLRVIGMGGVFLAAVLAKDAFLGKTFSAVKAGRYGLALVCAVTFTLGAVASMIAAVGAASEGQDERADPKAKLIAAYTAAEQTARDAETRLGELGRVPAPGEAQAMIDAALARVDAAIAKRTSSCTTLEPSGSGARQIAVNRQSCQPVQAARGVLARAQEADTLRADLKAARETLSKGRPKSADATAETFSNLVATFSSLDVDASALIVLFIAAFVEIGAPFAWAAWQLSGPSVAHQQPGFGPSVAHQQPARGASDASPDTASDAPKHPPLSHPRAAQPDEEFAAIKASALATAERSPLAALFAGEQPEPADNVVRLFPAPNGSPDGSGGPKGGRKVRANDRKADVLADIQARIDRGERFASQEELRAALAERFGPIAKSSLSDWLGELSDSIVRRQDGRRKVIG